MKIIKGLKTQESVKFNNFFRIVQDAAEQLNSVFFLEAGDGRFFETETLECEDLQGWLIPKEKESEFRDIWEKDKNLDSWINFFGFAIWERNGDTVKIKFDIS